MVDKMASTKWHRQNGVVKMTFVEMMVVEMTVVLFKVTTVLKLYEFYNSMSELLNKSEHTTIAL